MPCSTRRPSVLNCPGVSGAQRRSEWASARVSVSGSATPARLGSVGSGRATLEAVGRLRATIVPLSCLEGSPPAAALRAIDPNGAIGTDTTAPVDVKRFAYRRDAFQSRCLRRALAGLLLVTAGRWGAGPRRGASADRPAAVIFQPRVAPESLSTKPCACNSHNAWVTRSRRSRHGSAHTTATCPALTDRPLWASCASLSAPSTARCFAVTPPC